MYFYGRYFFGFLTIPEQSGEKVKHVLKIRYVESIDGNQIKYCISGF